MLPVAASVCAASDPGLDGVFGLRRSLGPDTPRFLRGQFAAGQFQMVVCPQIHSELRAIAEVQIQSRRRVGCDAVGRDAERARQVALRKIVLRQKLLLPEHLARDYR